MVEVGLGVLPASAVASLVGAVVAAPVLAADVDVAVALGPVFDPSVQALRTSAAPRPIVTSSVVAGACRMVLPLDRGPTEAPDRSSRR